MPLRIALAQVGLTVGDVEGNAALVRSWTTLARDAGAQLVAFPEMTLTGYPIEDLVFRESFRLANLHALDALAAESGDLAVVVGYLDRDEQGPRNAAAVLQHGRVAARYYKHFLPNYGVFDERRYFTPGSSALLLDVAGTSVALTICEDLWQQGGPVAAVAAAGAQVVLVVNGSPYESDYEPRDGRWRRKSDHRHDLVAANAAATGATFAYVNMTGGQDELVFDGDSMVVAPDGTVLARAARFAEELLVVDLDPPPAQPGERPPAELPVERVTLGALPPAPAEAGAPVVAEPLAPEAEVYGAVLAGTRDYIRKNGFRTVVLGLSGGIDSALTATIAVDAVGAENVFTVAMPSAYSSQGSLDDADELARRQGTRHSVVPIEPMVAAFHASLADHGGLAGIAAENLQARVRGMLLMSLSNEHGHLVLTTGNKSELATGFSTLYGDSAGGWAPIKDVPKTLVWALARWRNAQSPGNPPIPESSISKPPSAELAPGQLDADRLPPYDVLDAILDDYVERDVGRDELVSRGFDAAVVDRVIRLVDVAEYKRRQYPPGPKITPRAFGRDRRLPITNRWVDTPSARGVPETARPEQG
ncbi:MAG TPA: NAD+ synthase [Frankiaceae bacterium]|nr:NAD+ synthase [Frankiaceae bacterium]